MRDACSTRSRHPHDAIVIGSGAGGSTLAYQLALFGHRVLLIERGDFLRPRRKSAAEPIALYVNSFSDARHTTPCFVGGETKFYGAALYRMREADFRETEHEAGISPAWPISYSDLQTYYERAEIMYHVHGSANDDPSGPPRANDFPNPAIPHSAFFAKIAKKISESGIGVSTIPLGLDYGQGGRCVLCQNCDAHYCQIDAKMDAEIAALRPALATGRVELMTNTECLQVLTSQDGRHVTGAVLRRDEREFEVPASVVAVCAGTTGSPLLLRRSRTDAHPEGLGNASGLLGRYMAGHSAGILILFMGLRPLPPQFTKTFAINDYYSGAPDWSYPLGVIQSTGQIPFWRELPKLVQPMAAWLGRRALTCFHMTEALPTRDSGFTFKGDEIATRTPPVQNLKSFNKLHDLAASLFRRAGCMVLSRRHPRIWHEIGTARMGNDPGSSIVDRNCQIHGIEGLFVVDGSVLPSAGAVNPTLTIIAIAIRTADYISGHLPERKAG